MTITVSKQEFCDRVAELLALVEEGAEVLVQEPDKPEIKLANAPPRRAIIFDMHPGGWVAPDFADPLPEEYWEGTV